MKKRFLYVALFTIAALTSCKSKEVEETTPEEIVIEEVVTPQEEIITEDSKEAASNSSKKNTAKVVEKDNADIRKELDSKRTIQEAKTTINETGNKITTESIKAKEEGKAVINQSIEEAKKIENTVEAKTVERRR